MGQRWWVWVWVWVFGRTGRSLGQRMSSRSVRTSVLRLSSLILQRTAGGMSANMVDRAPLLVWRRVAAWPGEDSTSLRHKTRCVIVCVLRAVCVCVACCVCVCVCVLRVCVCVSYIVLTVGVAEAGDVGVGEQEVEGDGQEGEVSHEGEVLAVHDDLVQLVGEGQPVETLAHEVHVGVPHAHGQVVVVQSLLKESGGVSDSTYGR